MTHDTASSNSSSVHNPFIPGWLRSASCISLILAFMFAWCEAATAQVNILTRSEDNARTGANLNETILTPANVSSATFGKLFTVPTDGQIYAQPLYMSKLKIAGGTHNVVFIASMLNTVYALDADTGATLWSKNFGTPIVPKEVESDQNITWNTGIGILGTPVIDPSTNYMYFVSGNESKVSGSSVYSYNLNAIDIFTGDPVLNSPMEITGTYSTPDLTTPLTFVPKKQNQRPGLALGSGNVYVAFASHEDSQPYHGWVFAYSASSLAQTAVYSDTTTGIEGGIWNAGGAPTIDSSGNVYISTGNGSFGTTPNGLVQTGNSFIKLSPQLELMDYFTPYNSTTLNAGDEDLGSSGLLLIPNTNYLLGGGKQGVLYLDNTTDMGKFNASSDQVRQEFQGIFGKGTSHIHGAPIYFDSSVNGPTTYVWGENDYLRAFTFSPTTGLMTTKPLAMSTMTAPVTNNDGAMPGGFMTVSASGEKNGIVWAATPYNGNAVHVSVQGVVYAFDADTLAPLWSDKDNDTRDEIGTFAKYNPPVVANGKLYMATFGPLNNTAGTGALVVYGLLPTSGSVSAAPNALTFPATPVETFSAAQVITLSNTTKTAVAITSIQVGGADPSSFTISKQTCGNSLAAGAKCTFSVTFEPEAGGILTASVGIKDNAPGSPQTVVLTGTGVTAASATLSPTALAFPTTSIGSTSAAQTVTLSNSGGSALTIKSIVLTGANPALYAISKQTCGATLAGGAKCTFAVTFTPKAAGTFPASVTLTDSAVNSPQVLSMTGTGTTVSTTNYQLTLNLLPSGGGTVTTSPASSTGAYAAGTLVTLTATAKAGYIFGGWTGAVANESNATTTITMNAAATVNANFTTNVISTGGAVSYGSGFSSSGIQLNGAAALSGTRLRLTNGGEGEVASAFFTSAVYIQNFTNDFTFQLTNATGDGFMFVFQNRGTSAMGQYGMDLGFGASAKGIPRSVGIKFDLYNNAGEGDNSTGIFEDGRRPTTPAIDLTPSGVNLHSGDLFHAHMVYDGKTLTVTITDTKTGKTASQSYTVNLGQFLGGNTALVGFTGGTGSSSATQDILTWTYNSQN